MRNRDQLSRRHFPVRWLSSLLLTCFIFPAAADDGKPRYVSGAGRDQGDCLNRFRPCRSLSFAITQAGKGDRIQVAEGRYTIRNSKQLFDLLSVNGRIAAGFNQYSAYSERRATASTLLIGVPPEFRERFEAAGFTVLVDTKSLQASGVERRKMRELTAQVAASERSHAAAACEAGSSAGFACQSVSLLAHVSLQDLKPASARGNDVWGFTDLNTGREYALMGLQNGVAVLDITDPAAPKQVGSASGSSTTWRDIKIYQLYDPVAARWRAFAYATADAVSDFLMVLDLSGLPNGIEQVSFPSDFRAAHNAYIVNADYTYGLAQTSETPQLGIAGAGINVGNYRLYSLGNPRAPQLRFVANAGYAHDLASFPVSDATRKAQCPNAQGAAVCQVVSDFNENTVDIWDVTSSSAPQRLASHEYLNARYVHSGWWTEDGRYLLVHDELDERDVGLNTTVRVFDLSTLSNPQLAASWVGPTRATDHNGYAKGNRYYISNYSAGLTVLDITDPQSPTRVGHFDTFPASNDPGFVGAWGVYPFSSSGAIAVGDINSGLYLLRNETLASPRGAFTMSTAALTGAEGQALEVSVDRSSGTGAVSVQLEVLHGNTIAADATLGVTTLNWADGDTQPKSATLNLTADSHIEPLELLLVRLRNPVGGASIAYPDTTRVTIGDVGAGTRLRLLQLPTIDEGRGEALITVTRLGSTSGEARVSYRVLPGGTYSGAAPAQGELVWSDGDAIGKIATVALDTATLSAGQSGTFQMELSGAVGASLESADGTPVDVLAFNVNVRDFATPPTPPPPPPPPNPPSSGGGGGSGAFALSSLALLAVLLALSARPMARRRAKK